MDTLTIPRANAMPAPTWHRLRMNDADIHLPAKLEAARKVDVQCEESLLGDEGAFAEALAALSETVDARTASPGALEGEGAPAESDALDEVALSPYQSQELENLCLSPADVFATGMGDEAREYLEFVAGEPIVLATQPGERASAAVRIEGVDGAVNAAAIDVVAAPGSSCSLTIALDSPVAGTGVVGTLLRVFAGADAQVDVTATQTLDDSWIALDDAGIVLDERACVQVRHTVLGAGRSYTGLDADVRGNDARLNVDTRYLGRHQQQRDFNYVARQRGARTACAMEASGVLAGASQKTLRGTIELVRGCKGSRGSEQETVLLADDRARNRSVPVILCGEDDVAGNHGATIGHVRPEQLLYLASRGLSPDAAEQLFLRATLEEAAITAPDNATRAAIVRLGSTLAEDFEEAIA